MTQDAINADCRKDYYPASRTSGTRKLSQITLIVIHATQGGTALSIARWFHDPRTPEAGGPNGSAHLVVDENQCQRCLPNSAIPWGAPGANAIGFHIEQAGFAEWSREKWLAHRATIKRAAFKTAYHCHLFKIPVRLLSVADLKDGRTLGITTHARCSQAFGGDHTDPGAFYPLDVYMKYVRGYYEALSPS